MVPLSPGAPVLVWRPTGRAPTISFLIAHLEPLIKVGVYLFMLFKVVGHWPSNRMGYFQIPALNNLTPVQPAARSGHPVKFPWRKPCSDYLIIDITEKFTEIRR